VIESNPEPEVYLCRAGERPPGVVLPFDGAAARGGQP
jgi:hypothetical protein